jgi:hypothetical protein
MLAVRVHVGWEGRGGSPSYDGALQRCLVREELGDYLGPAMLAKALGTQEQ